ncbi:MAG: polysaccharide deacetylase family protein [Anaerotignum sp.]
MSRRKWICCILACVFMLGLCGCGQNNTIAVAAEPLLLQTTEVEPTEAEKTQEVTDIEKVEFTFEAESSIEYVAPFAFVLEYPQTSNEEINAQILEFVAGKKAEFIEKYSLEEGMNKKNSSQTDCEKFLYLEYEMYLVSDDQACVVFHETQELGQDRMPIEKVYIYHFDVNTAERIAEDDLREERFLETASAYTIAYFEAEEQYKNKIFGDYKTTLAPEAGRFERFALNGEGVLFYFDQYDIFPGGVGVVDVFIPYEALPGMLNGIGVEAPPVPEKEEVVVVEPTEKPKREIDPSKPMVALTFDDGPSPIHTERILDTLEQYNAVATFFDLGALVEAHPETLKRELALGCEVGSHSYSHKNFNTLSADMIEQDIKMTAEAFRNAADFEPTLFRPPYGNCNAFVQENMPLAMITWSVDTLDWKSKNAETIMNVVRNRGDLDGKVILMHGIYEASAEATEQMVPYLLEEGYQLVTISEMLQYKHEAVPEGGKLYGYSYFQ